MTCCKHCPEEAIPPPVPRKAREWRVCITDDQIHSGHSILHGCGPEHVRVREILPTDEKLGREIHVRFSDTGRVSVSHSLEHCQATAMGGECKTYTSFREIQRCQS